MKKFMMGLILGAGLMFTVSASAEVTNLVGSLIEGQFPVKVDGQTIESPGIVVNGTSYLPTRTIAELAGFDVKFDADMGVELVKKQVTIPESPVSQEPSQTPSNRNELTIEQQIHKIEREIEKNKMNVHLYQGQIELTKDDDVKAESQAKINEFETRIAELEAEKAALEAQLTP